MSLSVVVTTLGSEAEAQAIARQLVTERLAACVQIIPCESHYIYEGKQEASREWRLEMKTADAARERLLARTEELHPYDLPEVIALPIATASADYAAWVCNAVAPSSE
ncbi:MAG: divalent-cation tolerance protein CutA [Pseudomonadota bacterium]